MTTQPPSTSFVSEVTLKLSPIDLRDLIHLAQRNMYSTGTQGISCDLIGFIQDFDFETYFPSVQEYLINYAHYPRPSIEVILGSGNTSD